MSKLKFKWNDPTKVLPTQEDCDNEQLLALRVKELKHENEYSTYFGVYNKKSDSFSVMYVDAYYSRNDNSLQYYGEHAYTHKQFDDKLVLWSYIPKPK